MPLLDVSIINFQAQFIRMLHKTLLHYQHTSGLFIVLFLCAWYKWNIIITTHVNDTTIPAPTKLKITKITAAAADPTTCLRNDESLFYLSACVSICTSSQYILLFIIFNGKKLAAKQCALFGQARCRRPCRLIDACPPNPLYQSEYRTLVDDSLAIWLSCLFCVCMNKFRFKNLNSTTHRNKTIR